MRTLGGVAEHFAQAVDGFLERRFVIDEGIPRLKAFAQFFARHDFLGMFQQDLQNLEGLAREPLPHAGLANFTGLQVNFETPNFTTCGWLGLVTIGPALVGTERSLSRFAPEPNKPLREPAPTRRGESATCDGTNKPPPRFLTLPWI